MNLYFVRYDGLWLGGEALVFAKSENEAIEKVKNDNRTVKFEHVKINKLESKGVVYNSNGDY